MFTLTPLALLLLPAMVAASPQYMFAGDTSCDEMITTYTTTSTADVTTSIGDHGWQNYDGNICTAGTAPCSDTEGKSFTKSISIDFGGGPTFDLSKAVHSGLTFGVSVAWSTTTSQSTTENCVISGDDANPCVCGLQYMVTQQNAKGTSQEDNGCSKSPPKPFDVTSPVLVDGKARTQWRSCKASTSKCSQMANAPACADGL